MSGVDMSPGAISRRLAMVGQLSDLDPSRRFESKLDLSSQGITLRLRRVSQMRRLCLALAASRPATDAADT